ncbi:acyltransferase family protein [Levilactobacillus enshiensis]|uniref:acyltransferase family protein n=1 Tax=Levilactobacillus enshiensis TaxID=2590213 RepID=UPI00117B20EB|nr:acyltransferase family protein [Levilactobacillus enshiensis]
MNIKLSTSLKGFAILIVIFSHYYRYIAVTSLLHPLYHFGFLGAALFAFLSGYGVFMSYSRKGFYKGWFVKKIIKVYIPFLIVNLLAELYFYPERLSGDRFISDFLLGTNDLVLWYVPFILIFYFIFFISFKLFKDDRQSIFFLTLVYVIYVIVCEFSQVVGSPWYTSVGGLVLGVWFGHLNIKTYSIKMGLSYLGLTIVFMVLNLKLREISLMKDWTTIFAALAFCGLLFVISLFLFNNIKHLFLSTYIFESLVFIGNVSYWIYITHIKVLNLISGLSGMHGILILFFVITVVESYILNSLFNYLESNLRIKKND